MAYDAMLLDTLNEPATAILQSSLDRHRHRPLIIAGSRHVLQPASATLPIINDREKAAVVELPMPPAKSEEASSHSNSIESLLAPLAEMRAQSVLVLTASVEASMLMRSADKLTYVVSAARRLDQEQAMASKLCELVITEAAGYHELTGYPRPVSEQ
jgi:hypothetical protein